jgi:glutathione S-transferase
MELIMRPVLYGIGISLYVRKIRFILEYKGVEYDHKAVMPSQETGYLAISPIGKIPALTLGDFSIADSSVIALYLERKYPQKPILPENAEEYARALWFDEYSDTKMTEIISTIFFEKFGKPMIMNMAPDETVIAKLETRLPELFDYLENELEGKAFLAGGSVSIADFSVVSNLYNHQACGYIIDSQRWPNLSAYQSRMLENSVIAGVIAKEREEMPLG